MLRPVITLSDPGTEVIRIEKSYWASSYSYLLNDYSSLIFRSVFVSIETQLIWYKQKIMEY